MKLYVLAKKNASEEEIARGIAIGFGEYNYDDNVCNIATERREIESEIQKTRDANLYALNNKQIQLIQYEQFMAHLDTLEIREIFISVTPV